MPRSGTQNTRRRDWSPSAWASADISGLRPVPAVLNQAPSSSNSPVRAKPPRSRLEVKATGTPAKATICRPDTASGDVPNQGGSTLALSGMNSTARIP